MNQAYILFKLRNNYYYSANMFIWINNGKYITTINKKFIRFSLFIDSVDPAPPPLYNHSPGIILYGVWMISLLPPQLTPLTPFYIF